MPGKVSRALYTLPSQKRVLSEPSRDAMMEVMKEIRLDLAAARGIEEQKGQK